MLEYQAPGSGWVLDASSAIGGAVWSSVRMRNVGTMRSTMSPKPSWPWMLLPHFHRAPSGLNAAESSSPQDRFFQSVSSLIFVGE